jgi:hypothetical protein
MKLRTQGYTRSWRFFSKPVKKEKCLIIEIIENFKNMQGVTSTEAYPLKAVIEDNTGGAFFFVGKNIEKIAAPETHPVSQPGIIPVYPSLFAANTFADKEQSGRRFPDGGQDSIFLILLEGTGIPSDNLKAGKGLTYIFFSLKENSLTGSQKIDRHSSRFKDTQKIYHKIEGHIPERLFPGQELSAAYQAFCYGNTESGSLYIGLILSIPPCFKQIPEGKQH